MQDIFKKIMYEWQSLFRVCFDLFLEVVDGDNNSKEIYYYSNIAKNCKNQKYA
jgi:hypothetical protein